MQLIKRLIDLQLEKKIGLRKDNKLIDCFSQIKVCYLVTKSIDCNSR